ncbi:SpoIIE family protein phosphatase [Streptomyces lydicus]|nr:SpoIIE family protein phosphatase [Streptomyces lydicus]
MRALLAERAAAPPATAGTGAAAISSELINTAVLLTSELVTNAVMYAGTDIDVTCRIEHGPPADSEEGRGRATVGVVLEVSDRHPARRVRGGVDARTGEPGYGLQLVSALAESWGVTYRQSVKTVWFRLEATEGEPGPVAPEPRRESPVRLTRHRRGRRSRAGTPPNGPTGAALLPRRDQRAAGRAARPGHGQRAGRPAAGAPARRLVRDLAERRGGRDAALPRLARRRAADRPAPLRAGAGPARSGPYGRHPWPWPEGAGATAEGGSALAFPLVARDTDHGVLLLGRAGHLQMTDTVVRMVEDVARRVAQAVFTARQYTRQTTISLALQRRQLPASLASIVGVDTAIVYEPHGEGQTVGGDFYDVFPMGDRRWCFLLGDVQGKDPEAMSVTGLARHLVRLLAREGHGVESVLGRLNLAMAEESAEALELGGEQAGSRFLSLLYGELEVDPGVPGARCTVASAGHPPPLHLFVNGTVEPASEPQMLLGIDEGTEYHASSFALAPGETLLCVTDGVTERRCGNWQLDDNDGLIEVLKDGIGLGAKALAEHVRRAAHDFGTGPVEDDLSVLVLQAVPPTVDPRP